MATETAIVFASTEMLNRHFGGRVLQNICENLGSGDQRLPYFEAVIGFDEQNLVEFARSCRFPLSQKSTTTTSPSATPALKLRSTFENRVHHSLRLANSCTFQTANIADLRPCDQRSAGQA